jgi:hypothetical protein
VRVVIDTFGELDCVARTRIQRSPAGGGPTPVHTLEAFGSKLNREIGVPNGRVEPTILNARTVLVEADHHRRTRGAPQSLIVGRVHGQMSLERFEREPRSPGEIQHVGLGHSTAETHELCGDRER